VSESPAPTERHIPMGMVLNFRDLGGYETAAGGRTLWRTVYRADSLHKLTPAEDGALRRVGVQAVFDLRSAEERQARPSVAGSRHLPITSRSPTDGSNAGLRSREDGERWLREEYRLMLAHAAADFGALLSALAEPANRPAVFHCAGGKDRTGLAAALLLSWLGVARQTVLDDYELTSLLVPEDSLATVAESFCASGMELPAAWGLLSSPRWAMTEALDELDERYGGVESYLLGPAGMQTDQLDALREQLVARDPGERAV
jgi:protein-tyrosine phosphatase